MVIEIFQWSEKFSVGIELIDKQHQVFFSIANSLISFSGQTQHDKKEVESLFERLMYYAFYHFSTEEELLFKYKYPQTPEHVEGHERFREKINYLSKMIWAENPDTQAILMETAQFAITWLSNHILVTDMAYSNFLRAQGVE